MFSLLPGCRRLFASATQESIAIQRLSALVHARLRASDVSTSSSRPSTRWASVFSSLVGGVARLIIAARIGWPNLCDAWADLAGDRRRCLFAPDPEKTGRHHLHGGEDRKLYAPGELLPKVRTWGLFAVGLLWHWPSHAFSLHDRSLTALPADRPTDRVHRLITAA
jgi:hypothetical protein